MRITFPFSIKQIDDKVIEFKTSPDGRPLVVLDLHPAVRELVTEKAMDALHTYAQEAVVKDTIKVS